MHIPSIHVITKGCGKYTGGTDGFPTASCLPSRPSHPILWAPVVVSGRVRYPKSISGLYVLTNIHVNIHLDIHVHAHMHTDTHKTVKQKQTKHGTFDFSVNHGKLCGVSLWHSSSLIESLSR